DLSAYSLTVLETRGGLHAHIAFIGTEEIARRLEHASAFLGLVDIRPAPDPNGGYRREGMLGGRLKGSHRLDGGGDRVRLSRALERDAIEAGYVAVWKHSNAKRSPERKAYRPRALTRRTLCPAGQLALLPEIERPVSRLHQFGGGFIPPAVA